MGDSKKRKKSSGSSKTAERTDSKRPKRIESKFPRTNDSKEAVKKKHSHEGSAKEGFTKSNDPAEGTVLQRDARLDSKEKTEVKKKKRRTHHKLEKELEVLWEKFKPCKGRTLTKEYRSKKVSKALDKAHGNIHKIAKSCVSSRILRSCLKFCSKDERVAVFQEIMPHLLTLSTDVYAVHLVQSCLRFFSKDQRIAVFEEIKPHLLTLSTDVYAVHLVKKCLRFCSLTERVAAFEELMPHLLTLSANVHTVDIVNTLLDTANKKQVNWFISSMHGHVSSLLQQRVGSIVVERAFQLANASKKCQLLSELYSPEPQLFEDLTHGDGESLVNIISKMHLQKSSMLQHLTSVIQPILEKGIVDHSIIHTILMEYFSIADKLSAADMISQLAGSLLLRMIHTRNGSKVAILCIKHGTRKDRKKIIKAMNGIVSKIAHGRYSCLVLVSILTHVDDTEQSKLLTKNILREMQSILKDFLLDKNRRLPILQLLHPNCQSYLIQDDLTLLNASIPSFCIQNDASEFTDASLEEKTESSDHNIARRYEVLVDSGLAESLVDTCIENLEEMLFSHFGKDVIYEIAIGGADGLLLQSISSKLENLHEEIASLATKPKPKVEDGLNNAHVFLNFHANRTIRKLILESPAFAKTLWNSALKGKCEIWADGHSLKLVSAYLESSNSKVRKLAKKELRPLVDNGVFKAVVDDDESGRCNAKKTCNCSSS